MLPDVVADVGRGGDRVNSLRGAKPLLCPLFIYCIMPRLRRFGFVRP